MTIPNDSFMPIFVSTSERCPVVAYGVYVLDTSGAYVTDTSGIVTLNANRDVIINTALTLT